MTRLGLWILIAAATLCGACSPVSLTVTLFADNSRLQEVDVGGDKSGEARILIIDIRGLIADRSEGLIFGRTSPVDDLTAQLRKAADDASIKAILLRINSPGGTVTASDIMYREIRRFSDDTHKPVVVSMGELAASGGYYLSLAGDCIYAEPTTITGSIGVIIPTVNVSEGLGRIGIHSRSIISRPNKDLANPLEPPREEHYAILQTLVDDFYARFRSLVVERRSAVPEGSSGSPRAPRKPLDTSRIDQLTDGRVMSGERALEAGLVDRTGGLRDAFETAKAMAGVKAAKLVKYYREDEDKPRSPYARSGVHEGENSEINLVQLRMNGLMPGFTGPSGAYYLWIPPAE